MVTLDNFLTASDCEGLARLGQDIGFLPSTDKRKTSNANFCSKDCEKKHVIHNVSARIEQVTGIPYNNSAYLQLIRYEKSQYFGLHSDYNPKNCDRWEGPRVLTIVMYLNDVREGGETHFPELNLTVSPKRGQALIFPLVLDSNPLNMNEQTLHQSLPVIQGAKFAATAWLHLRDFKSSFAAGCTGYV